MAKNPFLDFDMQGMQKMMTDMKMPTFDWEALMAANRKNMEAFAQANALAAEGAQAILRRQGEILKGAMEDANRSLKTMLAEGTPEELAFGENAVARDFIAKSGVDPTRLKRIVEA